MWARLKKWFWKDRGPFVSGPSRHALMTGDLAEWSLEEMDAGDNGILRTFASGATRDTTAGKIDLEGAISPLALRRYGEYMLEHQTQSDGRRRDSDNWQKGFGRDVLIKSLKRHVLTLWLIHRGWEPAGPNDKALEDALAAIIFNVQAYLHEHLVAKRGQPA